MLSYDAQLDLYRQMKGFSYTSGVLDLGNAMEAEMVLPRWLKSNCVQLLSATSFLLTSFW
jgi:hypothetical protein